jgi:hypothetical protein
MSSLMQASAPRLVELVAIRFRGSQGLTIPLMWTRLIYNTQSKPWHTNKP